MNPPEYLEIEEDRAVCRPAGRVSLTRAVQIVTAAIASARARKMRKLLVDTTGLVGFDPPTIAERYFFINEWAGVAGGMLRIAVVARPEMIDKQKFGVTAAANAGLDGGVFESEMPAIAWLQSEAAAISWLQRLE